MAASVKIEFDDGSRVISQTLEEAAGVTDARVASSALSGDKRPSSCSIDVFYEVRMPAVHVHRSSNWRSNASTSSTLFYTRHQAL